MVKNENYFVLASIIVILFILMMSVVDLNYYIRKNKENSKMETKNTLHMLKEERPAVLNPDCLIVAGEDKSDSIGIVEGSLEKAKIDYMLKVKFEDITDDELQSAETIIINGSEFGSLGNADMLLKYLKKGKHIIFTSMPSVDNIETSGLKEIMGIKNITQPQNQEGVEFLQGFMIGGVLELPKLLYKAPKVELVSTTKSYVTGSKKSAVIWRNTYGESEIYVVNGPFFETNAGYGILSAIMAQINLDYIYPVVNAKVFTYTGLPYASYENTGELEEIYNRNAMQVQQDILIPDVISINKSRSLIPSGFLTDRFNKGYEDGINKYSKKQINNSEKDIYKLGGEVGIVYSGDLEKDIEIFHDLFNNNNFKSIRVNEENLEALSELIDKEQFSFIESVLGPWTVKKKSFEYLNENTVYIPFTIDGIANTDLDKLDLYSGITAFGAIIQNLDLEQIIFPKENKDNWMNVSRDYIKFIDSYRKKFEMIESRNITDTAESVKKLQNNSPAIEYLNNKIELRFKEWYGESYYILRTNKEVESIIEGNIEKIEAGVYLVTAKNKKVDINLRQINKYE
ncbi:MAG: DUF2194 domain-containing protein [Clostridium sp.]